MWVSLKLEACKKNDFTGATLAIDDGIKLDIVVYQYLKFSEACKNEEVIMLVNWNCHRFCL